MKGSEIEVGQEYAVRSGKYQSFERVLVVSKGTVPAKDRYANPVPGATVTPLDVETGKRRKEYPMWGDRKLQPVEDKGIAFREFHYTWADYIAHTEAEAKAKVEGQERSERARTAAAAANGPVLEAIRKVIPTFGVQTWDGSNDYRTQKFVGGESHTLELSTGQLAELLGLNTQPGQEG